MHVRYITCKEDTIDNVDSSTLRDSGEIAKSADGDTIGPKKDIVNDKIKILISTAGSANLANSPMKNEKKPIRDGWQNSRTA